MHRILTKTERTGPVPAILTAAPPPSLPPPDQAVDIAVSAPAQMVLDYLHVAVVQVWTGEAVWNEYLDGDAVLLASPTPLAIRAM